MAKEVESEFRLLPEEAVILRNDKVGTGSSILPVRSDELVLTNQALIHIKKELFGKVKEVVRYPLADICMSGGKPQAVLGNGDNVSGFLDVYFPYETAHFKMEWKSDAEDWIDAIIFAVTGEDVKAKKEQEDFQKLMNFAESVTGTVNGMKKAFGIKSTEQVACKCSSCGASISGIVDEVVVCPFCGTSNKMRAC